MYFPDLDIKTSHGYICTKVYDKKKDFSNLIFLSCPVGYFLLSPLSDFCVCSEVLDLKNVIFYLTNILLLTIFKNMKQYLNNCFVFLQSIIGGIAQDQSPEVLSLYCFFYFLFKVLLCQNWHIS